MRNKGIGDVVATQVTDRDDVYNYLPERPDPDPGWCYHQEETDNS